MHVGAYTVTLDSLEWDSVEAVQASRERCDGSSLGTVKKPKQWNPLWRNHSVLTVPSLHLLACEYGP